MFYNKWWKNSGDTCNKRQDRDKESKASALGVDNIGTSISIPFQAITILSIFPRADNAVIESTSYLFKSHVPETVNEIRLKAASEWETRDVIIPCRQ